MLTSCYFSNRCHLAVRLEGGFTLSLFLNMDGVSSPPGSRAVGYAGAVQRWWERTPGQEVCFLGHSRGSLWDEACLV